MRVLLLGLLCTMSLLAVEGETVYKEKCASCHSSYIPMSKLQENFMEHNNTMLNLKAPTLNQISYRLKHRIGDVKGDEDMHRMEVEAFVADYLKNPDKQKSICMPEIIQFFDTMPSMKGQITDEEISEVTSFIYDYDEKMVQKHSLVYKPYDDAIKQAKKEQKIVVIAASSTHCRYCEKMDREVFSDEDVVAALSKDFVAVKVNVSNDKLPLNLQAKMTPAFFFVNAEGKVIKTIPGSWNKVDFLEILKEAKEANRGDVK